MVPVVYVKRLSSRYVFITGCDSGFGHQLAVRLDGLGVNVIAGCLTKDGAHKLAEKTSDKLKTVLLDVTKPEDVTKAFEFVKEILPASSGLWGVVNNAGIGDPGLVEWHSVEKMKRVVDVNLWGTVSVSKQFLSLVKKGGGRIVNVASVLSRVALPGASAYSMSKFGVVAFSDALRVEMSLFGVSVHLIEPGFFRTNLTDPVKQKETISKMWEELNDDVKQDYGKEFITEVYKAVNFLLWTGSPDTSKVVGSMEHALLSTSPKVRYVIGWDNNLVWRWLALLPLSVVDAFHGLLLPKIKKP